MNKKLLIAVVKTYKSILKTLFATVFFVLVLLSNGFGEGTKQLMPTSSPTLQLVFYYLNYNSGGGWRNPFGVPGCAPEYRLNVHIKDPAIEKIYYGFKDPNNTDTYYQIRDSTDAVVVSWTKVAEAPVAPATTSAGYIDSWSEAKNGPDIGTVTAGYTPLIYQPTKSGDYYFEFARTSEGQAFTGSRSLVYFDISVVESSTLVIDGRVWSKAWQFAETGNNSPSTKLFIYADDGIVTKLNMNGWKGGHFFVNCNAFGADSTGNWQQDRKSFDYSSFSNPPPDYPQYKEFLNDPDPLVYPTGFFGEICDLQSVSYCDGSIDFLIKVNKTGNVTLHINSPEGITDVSGDVTGYYGCTTWDTLHWNGLASNGVHVQNGATVSTDIDYLNGLTNLPCNDIETSMEGIKVNIVRPLPATGDTILGIMWDDPPSLGLPASNPDYPGCKYPAPPKSGCHDFGNNQGDERLINSWWYYLTPGLKTLTLDFLSKPNAAGPILGPPGGNVCQGATYTFRVNKKIKSAEKTIWTLLNSLNDTIQHDSINSPDSTFTYTFGATMPVGGYTLTVKGWNASCGDSATSILPLTLNLYEIPEIGGPTPAIPCINTTSTFTSPTNLATWLWSATGGTVQGSATGSSANILWNSSGDKVVSLLSSTISCPSVTSTFNIFVQPMPIPYAGDDVSSCQGQALTIPNATVTQNNTYSWSVTSGLGSLSNTGSLSPTYTPLVGETGNATISLAATGLANCPTITDAMQIQIVPYPTSNAGSAASVCQNSTYTLSGLVSNNNGILWAENGSGSLNSYTSLTPTYTPGIGESGDVTLTLTAIANAPCSNASSQVVLTVNEPATAFAGPAATICEGSVFPLAAATASHYSSLLWTRTGPGVSGTFDFDNILNPTYTPSVDDILNGSVTLTLKAVGLTACADASNSMTLNITRQVTVEAGENAVICQTSTFTPNTANSHYEDNLLWTSNSSQGGTITGQTTTTPTYQPGATETGTVILTLTGYANSPCVDVFDLMELTINEATQAFAGPEATICEGSTYTLAGSTASGYLNVRWKSSGDGTFSDSTILHPVYTPSVADIAAGSVILTLKANPFTSCTDTRSSMSLNITRQVTVEAGENAVICQTSTFTPNTANSHYEDNLLWTSNSTQGGTITGQTTTTPTYQPGATETGTVILTLTGYANSPCSDVFDQMELTINEATQAFAGPEATICEGSTYTLAGSTASGYLNVRWKSSGDGTFSDSTILHPVYTPSVADIAAGSVILTLKANPFTSCTDTRSSMTLNITRQVMVEAGENAVICQTSTFTPNTAVSHYENNLLWTSNSTQGGTITGQTTTTPTYQPGATETGTVILTLTGYANSPCADVFDQMQLTINEATQAFAGPTATICEGSTYTLAGSTASGYLNVRWKSSGTGTFSDSTILHPVYTPSVADIAAGSVILTLKANPFTSCTDTRSSMTLNITRQVTVEAGENAVICQTSTFTPNTAVSHYENNLLWTSNSTQGGTITGQTTTTPTYQPGATETGTVILTLTGYANSPCADVFDQMELTINEATQAFAGPTATICEGSTYTLAGSTASGYLNVRWKSSGTGTFSDSTILHPVYTPSVADIAAGSVILTLKANPFTSCTDTRSSMTLNITRQVTVDAGENAVICQTSTFTPNTAVSQYENNLLWTSNSTQGGTITGQTTTTPTYQPGATETGTVILTLTGYANSPCSDVFDQMELTINEATQVFAGPTATICEGSTYTLAGSTASGYLNVRWKSSGTGTFSDSTILHPVYTPSVADIAAGSVILTLKANPFTSCTDTRSSMTLNITRQVTVDAGPDGQVCQTATFTVNSAAVAYESSFVWTTPNGAGPITNANSLTPTYTPGAGESGTIILRLSAIANSPCANVFDEMNLTISESAGSFAGGNATICQGSNYTLNGANASGFTSLLWSKSGSGHFNDSTLLKPVYIPSAADIAAGSVVLTLTSFATPPCLNSSSSMTLNITRQATANAGLDGQVCQNAPFTISGADAQYYNTIFWSQNPSSTGILSNINSLTPTYTPGVNESGAITLTLHANALTPCADVTNDMQLLIHKLPVAEAGANALSCQGFNHTVTGASGTDYSTIAWTENGTGAFQNPTTISPTYVPGSGEFGNVTFTLTMMGTNSCALESSSDTRTLTITPLPDVSAGLDAIICAANTLSLNAIQQYCSKTRWTTSGDGTFADTTQTITTYIPGSADKALGSVILTITGTGTGTCSTMNDVDQLTLTIDPMPAINAGLDGSYCVQNPIDIAGNSAAHYSVFRWRTSGNGIFNDTTLLNTNYLPGNIDYNNGNVTLTLWAQGRLSCASKTITDSRVLQVAPYPIVNAGPDDYICSNVNQFQLHGTGNNYNGNNIVWSFAGGDGYLSDPTVMNPTYFAGPVDLSTQNRSIIFTITLQGNRSCSDVYVNDQVELKIDPTPISNAGPDDEICGQRPYLLNPTAQFQNTIRWTTSGTGHFSDTTLLRPTYTPSNGDVGTTVVLTLNLQGCKTLSGGDFMWLTVHPDPTVTVLGSELICEGASTPISFAFTGSPPWSVTYTNGSGAPITVDNILSSPYTFTVNPPVTTTWWVTAANDQYCNVPADSVFGVGYISVNARPIPYTTTGSNSGYYCEGDTGVLIGLNNSQVGMNYELLHNGLAIGAIKAGTGSAFEFGIYSIPGQYSIRGTNPLGNCVRMMNDTINVLMNPTPVTDFSTNLPCTSDTTYFTLSGDYLPRTSTWFWDFGDGTYATYSAPYSPIHVYPTYSTYTVTLSVVDTNGCHYTVTHPVEVLPHPNAFFSTNTPNCLDGTTHFTDLSGNPPGQGYLEQWVWTFGDGTPNDTTNFPNTPNINHTYASSGTYPVTLTVRNNRGCSSFYQSTVTVTNRPIASFDYFSNCEDQNALFTDNSNENLGGQITAWAWDFGDPTTGALNTSILQNPEHLYTATGDFIVKLIVLNLNGCRDSIQDTVHVKAAPLANFFSSAGCKNSPTQFLADSTLMNIDATATYSWDFGDGGTAYSRNSYHTYLAPGTYSVKLTITDTAGCEGFKILPLTVTPPPTAHFTATTDNCQGQTVPFTDLSTANSGFLTAWHWDFGDGNNQTIPFPQPPNTSHTYSGTGIFNVTLTVTNSEGCTRSESNLVNVLEAPAAAFSSLGHCKGTPVAFTDQSTVSGTQNISGWKWDFGDPTSGVQNTSTSQNPTHTFATAATYTVKLITFTGNDCSDTTSKSITIKPNPVADFNTQSACANNLASFAPVGIATGSIATWYWTFGDGGYSTEQAPTHIYTSPGTYTVSLSIADTAGCADTRTKPIVIAPLPDANFGYTTPTCMTDAVSFTDLSGTTSGYVAKWIWDFGDGNFQTVTFPTPPNVTHAYSNAGTFNVSLTVKTNDSCTNQIVRVLTILPKPTAGFLHGASCVGNLVAFTDQSSSNTTGAIGTWSWDFGDPSTGTANNSSAQNPTHTYSLAGTYTAKLVVTIPGGCSDTATQQIVVSAPPTVDFDPTPGCNGDNTQFVSSTLVNLAATQSWYWQFGDGTTSILADPVHIYATSGLYSVTLVLTDTAGCTNTKTKAVTVIPAPLAAFSSSTPGCSGQAISFTDLSTANGGTLTTWIWAFGDGTDTTFTSAIPTFTHTYAQPGTFAATLQVLSAEGCQNQAQHTIVISPPPIAAFGYANTCEGQTAEFSDQTNLNGGTSLTQHTWDFGDPNSGVQNTSIQTNPTHNFTEAGQYVVKLVAMNASGCVDTLDKIISITPKPGLGFYDDSLTCLGNTTTLFTDTLLTQTAGIAYFEWDFGDGSPHAFTQNASHHYAIPGTFSVTLLVQDTAGCENALTKPLTIHTAPIPAFSFSGICQNSPTEFTDLSQAPTGDTITSWYWDFGIAGSTDTSTLKNPDFTYTAPGTYTVKLITATENGCSNEKSLPLQVWNTPKAVFNYSASPCANGLVQFQDSSWSYQGTVTSWQWVFEPYQFGTGTNPSHLYYAVDSCYEVKLAIQDLRGCVDTTLKTVCVPAPLTVSFVPTPNCFGQPAAFVPQMLTPEPQADSLITFNWNFGDPASGAANTSTQKLPTHTFSNIGFYTVNFTAVDKFGCSADAYKTIEVKALPMANFTYTTGTCDSTVSFLSTSTDTSGAINTYIWQYGDGSSDTLATAQSTHKYTSSGSYVATLTVINQNGCTSSLSDTVTRSACLVAAYQNPASLLCQNYDLRFADISTCDGTITQWEWDFGDGSAPTQYNTYQPITNHTFADPGTYTIKLKVSTQVGTSTVSDSTEVDILVRPTPKAGFTANPVCLGEKTVFSDTTLANGATALSYQWEFGDAGNQDTSNLKNPNYLYSSPGEYTTELVATNQFGCADTATKIALVNGLPGANYSNSLACTGQATYFFDASQNYMAPVSAWVWRVRDTLGYLGNMQGSTPTFVFDSTGNYTVMLAVADTNGCADTITQQVKVDPSPSSAFDFTDNVDEIQGQLQFTNGSTGGTEYYWDFGNGETSYRESPLITYQEDGTYQIMLVTVSGKGCQDTSFSTYEMIFKGLYVPNAFAPGGSVQSTRLWKPVGVNLAQYLAEVYDSHGAKIWSSSLLDNKGTPVEGWDGSFNEKPCQQDVYVWKISAVFRDGSVWYNKDVGEHKGLTEPVWGTMTLIK